MNLKKNSLARVIREIKNKLKITRRKITQLSLLKTLIKKKKATL
jgi:hypothetical protein